MFAGSDDWRIAMAAFDVERAREPASIHAANLLLARGLNAAAANAYREYLFRAPADIKSWTTYALLLRRLARREESEAALAEAARLEARPYSDRDAVARFFEAASCDIGAPARAPAEFVTKLFDDAAERFDSLVQDGLEYRGPELLRDAVVRAAGGPPSGLDILDLGCGSGLSGAVFRSFARRLDGVDLSSKMLEQAAAKNIYDALTTGDLAPHLDARPESCDLLVASDVFVYLGDLQPVFAAARAAARAGGRLAFTTEIAAMDGLDFQLQGVRRYAHSREYLARLAEQTGWTVEVLEEGSTRLEAMHPVRSWIGVYRRR